MLRSSWAGLCVISLRSNGAILPPRSLPLAVLAGGLGVRCGLFTRLILVQEILPLPLVRLVLRRQMERPLRRPRPEHHRLGADAGLAVVVDEPQHAEEERGVLAEAEDAQRAHDARDAQVVVAEARDPVVAVVVEAVAQQDLEVRVPRLRPRRLQPVEVQHPRQRLGQLRPEFRPRPEGVEGGAVDDGGGRVEGRAFGQREQELDVVVAVFEVRVREGEDGG